MKGLIYPLTGLLVIAVVAFAVGCATAAIQRWRETRAVRAARWEPYTDVGMGSGMAQVGIQLVARWGHHHKILQRDDTPTRVPAGMDHMAELIDAQDKATQQAESYNYLRTNEWGSP